MKKGSVQKAAEPASRRAISQGAIRVALSIGSNIERQKNITLAIKRLGELFGGVRLSPVYETVAVGFEGPAFYNLVALIETDLPIDTLSTMLHAVEAEAGRVRGAKTYGNRTLDIDILLYGDRDLRAEGRNIPRDEIASAAYVLRPLADLLPDETCPLLSSSFVSAWAAMQAAGAGDEMLAISLDFAASV